MWPSVAGPVSPVNVKLYVNTFVDVSSVAVNVPLPVGLPTTDGSFAGDNVAVKFTIFETGGVVVESLPHAARATVAAASTSVIVPFFIMGSWTGESTKTSGSRRRIHAPVAQFHRLLCRRDPVRFAHTRQSPVRR